MSKLDHELRYRKVSLRMHADERVRKLSRPQPCGLALWHELMFGEQTDIIPGLFRIGEAAFAEQIGWTMKGFRNAWNEIVDAGLGVRADWSARLVWIPNALKHNMPASPNVVLSWRDCWHDRLPECALKEEAKAFIKASLKAFSEPYAKSFAKVCGEAFDEANSENPNVGCANQEQGTGTGTGNREQGVGQQNPTPVAGKSAPPPSMAWDPGLLSELKTDLGKDETDNGFARFLVSSLKYSREQREAAAREFMARGCAKDGKGPAYLLAMIRDGAGKRAANGGANLQLSPDLATETPGRKFL